MKFEVGKAYQHTTGEKLQIICEVDTFFYGHGLLFETDSAEYGIAGMEEENAMNYYEIPMSEFKIIK